MRLKRTALIGVTLAALILSALPLVRTRSPFAAGLHWAGRTANNYSAFTFVLTNEDLASAIPTIIYFQWKDRSGAMDGSHAELCLDLAVEDRRVRSAFFAIPGDATEVRVLACAGPGATRRKPQDLFEKLPWRLQRLFPGKWLHRSEFHSPLFPWIANPCVERTGTNRSAHLQFARQLRLVPAAHAHRSPEVWAERAKPKSRGTI